MNSILLSVVVPTKNRYKYLKSLISVFISFQNLNMELVIEDNSDDNSEILKYLKDIKNENIVYNYDNSKLSVVENSDRAIKHSSGKYITFIGDDDTLSKYLYDFVKYMDENDYETAIFNVAKYYWPGIEFKAHNFPNLVISNGNKRIRELNALAELNKILKKGGTTLGLMPKVYHGVVLRKKLDDVFAISGTYFPGPSPDMGNAVALALVVKKHIFIDLPLITAGASPKSTAGLGAKHKHEGKINEVLFLPNDTEKHWSNYILKVWTGPTIYAQSALVSLDNMKKSEFKKLFNFNYHYAYLAIFCSNYKKMLRDFNKDNDKYSSIKYTLNLIFIFLYRVRQYINNVLLIKFNIFGRTYNCLNTTVDASLVIDKFIESKYKNIGKSNE